MAVSSPALLALVCSYLMSLSLLTTRHRCSFFGLILFYFHVIFYAFNKHFCRFERGNIVCWDFDGGVFGDVSSGFFRSSFDDKTSKTS